MDHLTGKAEKLINSMVLQQTITWYKWKRQSYDRYRDDWV
jgi:hypothetical protein